MSDDVTYLIHVTDNCPWCNRAKALLEEYGASYRIETSKCEEWPTWPAIYRLKGGEKELIGGYNQLIAFSYESGL